MENESSSFPVLRRLRQLRLVMVAVVVAGAISVGTVVVTAQQKQASPTAETTDCVGETARSSPVASPSGELCVEVGSFDIDFRPNVVTIPADTPVTIMTSNRGMALHNLSIDDHNNPDVENLEISLDIAPGDTVSATINAPPGTYYFYCNVPGHEAAGMYGYLIVEPGAKITAAVEEVTPPAGGTFTPSGP